ncbi:PPOX class F420-dependent oxidoreductase [Nonomuraea sp. NPDC050783]|uniref:PPOX class F420-dependent oxidoreductase n=1 Tax=Nonomuraea sp. NPDC050783 TaxID=3154634 RepID=UPI00346671C3
MVTTTPLPAEAVEWFSAPNLAYVSTIEPDGRPQLSVVWVTTSADGVLFSTIKGRRKHGNLLRDPRVSILAVDPASPYRYCEIRGSAIIRDDPEGALIQELSQRYTRAPFTDRQDAQRVIVTVRPERVFVKQ